MLVIEKSENNNIMFKVLYIKHLNQLKCSPQVHNKAKVKKHKAESVSYFSTPNLLTTLAGSGNALSRQPSVCSPETTGDDGTLAVAAQPVQ